MYSISSQETQITVKCQGLFSKYVYRVYLMNVFPLVFRKQRLKVLKDKIMATGKMYIELKDLLLGN